MPWDPVSLAEWRDPGQAEARQLGWMVRWVGMFTAEPPLPGGGGRE